MSETPGDAVVECTRAIAAGDPAAFARFYEEWFDLMYLYTRRLTRRDEAFCLDIVHDAMLRAIRSIPRLDSTHSLKCWIRVTVHSCAIDRLRRDARRRRRESATGGTAAASAVTADPVPAPSEELAWLRHALAELPPDEAQLLTMRHRFGWSLAAIGRRLGLSAGAVDGRLTRSLERLRRHAREVFDA